jgi:hypothetical protein
MGQHGEKMAAPLNAGWRAMAAHGFGELSPPEAQHAMLELPTNRADYVGVLQDLGDYPARSPIGHRVPSEDEVAALKRAGGRWRAVVAIDDERALKQAACTFDRLFVLDPFFDSGALLYAAWHDPIIRDEHSRRLAEQTAWLVRLAPLLNAATAVLAPDHLPGSWNPRPGWRRPRATEDRRQVAGWSMRSGLVLLYWADRLDAVACATRRDVVAALDVALGPEARSVGLELPEPMRLDEAPGWRERFATELAELWRDARRMSLRRRRACLDDLGYVLSRLPVDPPLRPWRLSLGETGVPEPAMLIRRVLNGEDPERQPPLPRRRLKRRPLCLVPA